MASKRFSGGGQMDADEQKVFLGKVSSQLNKKLETLGLKSVVVPGTKHPWEINCLTPKGLYSMTYYFSAGQPWYQPEGEHQLFLQMPPRNNYIAYPRTDASQTLLVSARRLAEIVYGHLVDNENRPAPVVDSESTQAEDLLDDEDITFNSDYSYADDFEYERDYRDDEELETEKRQREVFQEREADVEPLREPSEL